MADTKYEIVERLNNGAYFACIESGVHDVVHLVADDIKEAASTIVELAEALEKARSWLKADCRPDAEFVAQGHNWNMSDEDRERGVALVARIDSALSLIKQKDSGS